MGSIHLGHWNIIYATVMRGNTANGKLTLGQFSVDHDNNSANSDQDLPEVQV